jgi:hypothetical protein
MAVGGFLGAGAAIYAPRDYAAGGHVGSIIDAAAFGVLADGVNDDAPALIKAVAAMTSGSLLVLPAGVIALGSAGWTGVTIRGLTNIRVQGNGAALKWLAAPSQATGPFGPTGLRFHECNRASISNLSINGNGIDCIGLGLEACSSCVVSEVEAYAHGGARASGLGQLVSCKGRDNSWLCCCARDSTPGSQYRGFYLGNGNSGWGETDLRIQGCSASNNNATGFAIGATRLICMGSSADGNAGAGFISGSAPGAGSYDHLFVGNMSRRNAFHGWQTDVYGPNVERIVLSGNNFSDNAFCGVFCHKGRDVSIYGNVLSGNGGPTGSGAVEISMSDTVIVSDNLIEGDAGHGICISLGLFANKVNGLIIANNRCVGSASKTVWMEARDDSASLTKIVFSGNVVEGGSHGLYVGTSTPGARIDDVTICNNIIDGGSTASYFIADATPGQSTNLRLMGNTGGRALISEHVMPAADADNCWNAVVGNGSASPRVGAWKKGSILFNSAPEPGSPIGWVCTASGTPGTWHGFGAIEGGNRG